MKKQKRARQREARRELRKKNWAKLRRMLNKTKTPKSGDKVADKFNEYWPFFRQALVFLRDLRISRKRADDKIDKVIAIGDRRADGIASNQEITRFEKKLEKAWKVIRFILNVAIIFTDEKRDDVIDKIIDIGNWLTGLDDDEEEDIALLAGI